jgi:hypothetical protein
MSVVSSTASDIGSPPSQAKLAYPMLVLIAGGYPDQEQEMKSIVIVSLLACLGLPALADDQATPTPTPIYPRHLAPAGSRRRMRQLERQRERQAEFESRQEARGRNKANRRSAASAQEQGRAAERAREEAQRQVEAEAQLEKARETPHAKSDLMKRMGFSDQEVAAQKALEQSAKPGANPSPSPAAKPADQKPANTIANASPAPEAH